MNEKQNKLTVDNFIYVNIDKYIVDTVQYKHVIAQPTTNPTILDATYKDLHSEIGNKMSDVITDIATRLGLSLIFETTGVTTKWYTDNTLSKFKQQGYKVYIIYPFVDNITELIRRAEYRALTEFRRPSNEDMLVAAKNASINIHNFFYYEPKNGRLQSALVDYVCIYDNSTIQPTTNSMVGIVDSNLLFEFNENIVLHNKILDISVNNFTKQTTYFDMLHVLFNSKFDLASSQLVKL
jgi:hypothetical protein